MVNSTILLSPKSKRGFRQFSQKLSALESLFTKRQTNFVATYGSSS